MSRISRYNLVLFLAIANLIIIECAFAQKDTTSVRSDTTQVGKIEEIVLEEIFIEAVIEKPNVAILPTREDAVFEEMDFIDRSFEHELNSGPEKLWLLESELENLKKIEIIKKVLAKDKN
ncbi:MAG: hypothetical protein ACE5IW_00600 [bacterium]